MKDWINDNSKLVIGISILLFVCLILLIGTALIDFKLFLSTLLGIVCVFCTCLIVIAYFFIEKWYQER